MRKNNIENRNFISDENLWDYNEWQDLESKVSKKILASKDQEEAFQIGKKMGKKILKNYSNSFFTVTRFLPKEKRDLVEIIYASVRYPDEIVDTFDMSNVKKKSTFRFLERAIYSI